MVFSRCFFHMVCARAARLTLVGCTVSVRVCVWARSRNVRRAKFDTWQRSRSRVVVLVCATTRALWRAPRGVLSRRNEVYARSEIIAACKRCARLSPRRAAAVFLHGHDAAARRCPPPANCSPSSLYARMHPGTYARQAAAGRYERSSREADLPVRSQDEKYLPPLEPAVS